PGGLFPPPRNRTMSRTLLPLLSALLLAPAAARAADQEDARTILTRALKAHGGEAALTRYQACRMKTTGKLNLPKVGESPFTQEVSFMLPDKFKESMQQTIGPHTLTTVTKGSGGKISIDSGGIPIPVHDRDKKAAKQSLYAMKVGRILPLVKDKGYTF